MNVNIHTGGSKGSSTPKVTTSGSVTGQTAQGSSATTKLGKIVGGVGKVAAKFGGLIPGVGGIVSKLGSIFSKNDPEWWRHVPSTGVSTNVPLTPEVHMRTYRRWDDASDLLVAGQGNIHNVRPAILEINSIVRPLQYDNLSPVLNATDEMVSTYLMQEIRRVVNAIPLVDVKCYRDILANSATAYALKKQLDKMIVLTKDSKPFIPSLTDGSFPLLSATYYAQLVAARDLLAEYIKASVKLPHTLCQYLSWRFGRVYRMGTSEKAGLVMYNVIPLDTDAETLGRIVSYITGFASSNASYYAFDYSATNDKPRALADMYNAYIDHVIDVEVAPDTQFIYDPKEFVLRTNLDINPQVDEGSEVQTFDHVYMDSHLDNATTFVASTVSTEANGVTLFPVKSAVFYHQSRYLAACIHDFRHSDGGTNGISNSSITNGTNGSYYAVVLTAPLMNTQVQAGNAIDGSTYMFEDIVLVAMLCKACEFYNVELYGRVSTYNSQTGAVTGSIAFDLTAPSTDLGLVQKEVLANTHRYAFANLVFANCKSLSKEVAALNKEAAATLVDIAKTTTVGPDPLPTATEAIKQIQA